MNTEERLATILPSRDAMEVIRGKWKIPIILTLTTEGRRYNELSYMVTGISSKVLSSELHDLEENCLIEKKCINQTHSVLEYHLTIHGRTLLPLIQEIASWGKMHRKVIIGQ
jgi:DNA-binding HxlR family transcriptional regulator